METFSDCIAFMTPHTTPMFDFNEVISALTTPTPTPSLVKTNLKRLKPFVLFAQIVVDGFRQNIYV